MRRLLLNLEPVLKALEISTRTALGGELSGSYVGRFKGRGLEFDGYTEYGPQEDAEMIDWKASTRANKLLIKEYVEERNLDIVFLLDASNAMVFTTGKKLKAEYAAEMIISLSFIMMKNSDKVGLIMFSDKIIKSLLPQGGTVQYFKIIDCMLNSDNYGGGYDLKGALAYAFSYTRPKAMMIIVTDFIGLRPGWKDIMESTIQRFDVIVLMVRDPADFELPPTKRVVMIRDPFSDQKIRLDPEKAREKYREYVQKQEKDLEDYFNTRGVSFLKLDTSKEFVEPLIEFFKERKRLSAKGKY